MLVPRELRTLCGNIIHLNDDTVEHLRAHPEAGGLLEEAAKRTRLPYGKIFHAGEINFGQIIGQSSLVERFPDRPHTFAVRIGRDKPTHVVVGGVKLNSSLFTLVAVKRGIQWFLITGYVGANTPKEPTNFAFSRPGYNRDEFSESIQFWTKYGLVWESNVMGPYYESTWDEVLSRR
ncbi:MAG: hypothetical protein A2725_01390 [Candidatus Magasanikbacteria bacterium RIFCSPHIGHO2_01_FULL_33_34]|uniref:Uncharacterized protein n=1 Tax=Candidatus Magasanikbacteria bacterium RIFCSPHIGHO2_01_FULL_33_34 TaxID=1798671 RepID=A0A1F6LJ80_9BACT|nr:MAG: hypothetical protein A2725_01390 [Candidatus Magasanikbacteria bacterium RIFCSPHIGHO2_01_FULL_33_34]OGH65471.1 MAG: hypothetical protein A3B83_01145 [Candidatus Magasanikbacteria bacterium RIFCSPHIGHO2_02_FULL_33_17]OGH76181.1 MAG: hypothetical protein A3A89_01965 [Candidatus Magasanikbacteria bacterium RIFCSPLOWO2_01_FULL_33_34]